MDEYVKDLREYLENNRSWSKAMFRIVGTIYRGVTKNRFTYEQGLKALDNLHRGVL